MGRGVKSRNNQGCAVSGPLTSRKRAALPDRAFALVVRRKGREPQRKYPLYKMSAAGKLVPSANHAANAKARAAQQRKKGNLTAAQYAQVVRRANAVLARCKPKRTRGSSEREQKRILSNALSSA